MDKARRNELKQLKFKKRLAKLIHINFRIKHKYYALKNHSTPCSCYLCKDKKYREERAKEKQLIKKELKEC